MAEQIAEDVYYALLGELADEYCLDWVESAFAPGSFCECSHAEMLAACDRLYNRLGAADDEDLETVINALLDIQKSLCLKMFEYGLFYRKNTPRP